jgi:hypothetical protein
MEKGFAYNAKVEDGKTTGHHLEYADFINVLDGFSDQLFENVDGETRLVHTFLNLILLEKAN